MAGANAASVLIVVPIDYVMTAVFDAPVAAIGIKDLLRIGLLRSLTGDAVSDFTRELSVFFVGGLALYDKGLADVRKIQIVVELRCRPDLTDFNAAVIRRVIQCKIGFFSVRKVQCDVLEEPRLIVFYSEMVMGVALFDQISADFTLGQQGIGGDIFPLDVDGVQHRDDRIDFVCALDSIVVYRQGSRFFWV